MKNVQHVKIVKKKIRKFRIRKKFKLLVVDGVLLAGPIHS